MSSSKPKSQQKVRAKGNRTLAQLGLLEVPDLSGNLDGILDDDDDDHDEDLEAELSALMSSGSKPAAPKVSKVCIEDISKMTANCMKDISDDDEDETINDDDVNDPALLKELQQITQDNDVNKDAVSKSTPLKSSKISILDERLTEYVKAEADATANGDMIKARRFKRAIKTLKDLLKDANSGKPIQEDDIPPAPPVIKKTVPVSSTSGVSLVKEAQESKVPDVKPASHRRDIGETHYDSPVAPSRTAPLPPVNVPSKESTKVPLHQDLAINNAVVNKGINVINHATNSAAEGGSERAMLVGRRDQYKMAALQAKRNGDSVTAIKFIKTSKQFDAVIEALNNGQPVDLSNMPPPLSVAARPTSSNHIRENVQSIASPPKENTSVPSDNATHSAESSGTVQDNPETAIYPTISLSPQEVVESLNQRRGKFEEAATAAKQEGNNSKARRIGRIVKQYEEAIKFYKAGKSVNFEDLPNPQGFQTITVKESETASKPQPTDQSNAKSSGASKIVDNVQQSSQAVPKPPPRKPTDNRPPSKETRPQLKRAQSTVVSKQMNFLLERQKLFKLSALECKKKGETQQAIEYLRIAKGIDPMIQATEGGLPVDVKTIPIPPQLKQDFEIVEVGDCQPDVPTGDGQEMYKKLEQDLMKQLRLCLSNREHFTKQGDVASASKFEHLAIDTKKDIQVIQNSYKRNDPVPKFHYETRSFSIVQCNTDLSENDMELSIVRGVNLPGKVDELDTYVRFEFPHPSENPQKNKTKTVYNTVNPEFRETFKLEIVRKSRAVGRLFKRNAMKVEVWSKGGIFKSDSVLGTVKVTLNELESKCSLHDSFDLVNGRKACGGKLEVKVRIKEPLLCKQVERLTERWLVIGR